MTIIKLTIEGVSGVTDKIRQDERARIATWIRSTCSIWEEGIRSLLEDLADQIEAGDHQRFHDWKQENTNMDIFHGIIGDLDPIEHGGGIVSTNSYGPWLRYFEPLEDQVHVYQIPIPLANEFLPTFNWVGWNAVARTCDVSPEELKEFATSPDPIVRAGVLEAISAHYGWANLDEEPTVMTREEAEAKWGPEIDRALDKTEG